MSLPASPAILATFFLARLFACGLVEWRRPAYAIRYRDVFLADLFTMLLLVFVTLPFAGAVYQRLAVASWLPIDLTRLRLSVRLVLYVVLADLGHYWMHRLMHTRLLWRVHRWHHSPTHTSWLGGNRESVLDRLLVELPYFLLSPVLGPAPHWVYTALLFFAALRNDWMHLNVPWGWRPMEWLLVTPRYHHIHHSVEAEHHDRNLSVFFSVWDHLFGTYRDPEGTVGRLEFGIGEKVNAFRLFVGL